MSSPTDITTPSAQSTQVSTAAILFADVSGSTRLYEALGDAKARRLIARSIELMTAASANHGGELVKTIGDEVMCRLPAADDAAAAALDMQEAIAQASIAEGGFNLAIHVGFHYGPVVLEEGDIFGDAVNVASRMVNLAKRDQILTTGATFEALSPRWRKALRQVDRAAVRGKQDAIDVYELVWQEAEATRIAGSAWKVPVQAAPECLVLSMGAHQVELTEAHPSATAGRAEQNDLVVSGDLISRLHARIDYRNGRFLLSDQSTNGTWVTDAGGAERLVRHDTHPLTGSGTLSLGRKPEPGQTDLLRYRVVPASSLG